MFSGTHNCIPSVASLLVRRYLATASAPPMNLHYFPLMCSLHQQFALIHVHRMWPESRITILEIKLTHQTVWMWTSKDPTMTWTGWPIQNIYANNKGMRKDYSINQTHHKSDCSQELFWTCQIWHSHSGDYEEYSFLGCDVMQSGTIHRYFKECTASTFRVQDMVSKQQASSRLSETWMESMVTYETA